MSEKTVYKGKYIQLTEQLLGRDLYEKAYIKGAVIIFPIDQNGQIILIKEKRPHEKTGIRLKPVTGFLEDDLTWQENSQKELQEEIGLKANSLELIHHVENIGSVNVHKYFVLAKGLTPSKIDNADDEGLILGTFTVSIEEFLEKTLSGEIYCNFDSMGILLLELKLRKGLISLD